MTVSENLIVLGPYIISDSQKITDFAEWLIFNSQCCFGMRIWTLTTGDVLQKQLVFGCK